MPINITNAVSAQRLLVSEMLPKEEHLLVKRQADFFLDSLGKPSLGGAVRWHVAAVLGTVPCDNLPPACMHYLTLSAT